MSPRPYRSPQRDAAATQTRARILKAAAATLRAPEAIRAFSLEAVAKRARVTRLTVYNQFGSRRALLEAVFDERAAAGGLHRIVQAMQAPDPQAAVLDVIAIFCDFWSFDPGPLGYLHAAGADDPEFDASVRERNERRRHIFAVLVGRIAEGRADAPRPKALADLVDVLFALSGFAFFAQLTAGGRTAAAACGLIQEMATDAVRRTMGP
jgi:AcrR family transcriptional regulator